MDSKQVKENKERLEEAWSLINSVRRDVSQSNTPELVELPAQLAEIGFHVTFAYDALDKVEKKFCVDASR